MNRGIQKQVADFVEINRLETDIAHRTLDLVSELGEVSKEILTSTVYGRKPFQPTSEWQSELGDLLFALVCVANSTGVDLEQALLEVLKKYQTRLKSKQDAGSGK